MRLKKVFLCLPFFALVPVLLLSMFSVSACSDGVPAKGTPDESRASGTSDSYDPVLPQYSGFINDFTGTLSSEWLSKTEELAKDVEEKTTCEIGVAVIDDLGGISIEEYAVRLFEEWGIGKKDNDNGVLLLVSLSDRELRIEVGYGLEATITDLEAKVIIDDTIVPAFKQNEYGPGIYNGVASIANIIYEEEEVGLEAAYAVIAENLPKKPFVETWVFVFIIVLVTIAPWLIIGSVFLAAFLKYYIRKNKCPRCKRLGLKISRRWLSYPTYESPGRQEVESTCRYCGFHELKTATFAKKTRTTYSGSSGSSSSGSSGSFSSGSSSGSSSSSSFGGGSSGGGGASGSW
ncbi:MAG: TPM domain-containing protein [Actinobacteria bacterium]|nr:TPM domain-containing protein [Actinomycetota bacterium]